MKPLPYRARRVDTNELVYGWYIKTINHETHWIIKDDLYCSDIRLGLDSTKPQHLQGCYEVHEDSVSQSTGEVDINKQEIFGGMWLKASIYGDETPQELQVVWRGTAFVIDYKDSESECVILSEFVGSVEIIPEGDKT